MIRGKVQYENKFLCCLTCNCKLFTIANKTLKVSVVFINNAESAGCFYQTLQKQLPLPLLNKQRGMPKTKTQAGLSMLYKGLSMVHDLCIVGIILRG